VEQQRYAQWFLDNAGTAFDPPLTILDTTDAPIDETARQIRNWAMTPWEQEIEGRVL